MKYLSSQEILYIHHRVVGQLGGIHGVENTTTLKKATNYIHNNDVFPDKFSKAAAIFFAIAKKKPFSDLNTATALTVIGIFLKNNKHDFDIKTPSIQEFIENDLKKASLEDITTWISDNSSPIKKG